MMQTASVLETRLSNFELPANQLAARKAGCKMESIQAFMEYREILRMVTGIHECGHRVAEIVENMLSFARKNEASASSRSLSELLDKAETMACVEIEDNGPGMDEKVRRKVFEPFFTTKPPGEGTGLGLSVAYFIITENHGGELAVESQPGIGTKFVFRLPLRGKPPGRNSP